MKITVEAPFDLGGAFGVGDIQDHQKRLLDIFERRIDKNFSKTIKLVKDVKIDPSETASEVETIPYGVRTPFGAGVRLVATAGPLADSARQDALAYWDHFSNTLAQEFTEEARKRIAQHIKTIQIEYVSVFLFPAGLGYVRISLRDQAIESADVARGLYKAFEFGAYGDFVPDNRGNAFNQNLALIRNCFADTFGADNPLFSATRKALEPNFVLIYGFTGIVFIEPGDGLKGDEPGFFRRGDEVQPIEYGDSQLQFSWWIVTVNGEPQLEISAARFLYMLMVHLLSWDLCRNAEIVFDKLIKSRIEAVIAGASNRRLNRKTLNILKQFAAFVLISSETSTVSEFAGDHVLHKKFDDFARVGDRQQRIHLLHNAFVSAEADEIAANDQRLARSTNSILLILTIASLSGVCASILDAWFEGVALLGRADSVIAAITAPPLIVMGIVLLKRVVFDRG